jgi:hypothetical protein
MLLNFNVKSYYWLTVVFATLMSMTMFYSPLVSDENFILFTTGPEFAFGRLDLINHAYQASASGWAAGRWVPFTTHLLSDIGVLMTFKFSDVFNINIITAYGFMRIALNISICLTALKIFEIIFKNNDFEKFSDHFLKLLALILPMSLSTNALYSSGRSFIWSYTLSFQLSLIFTLFLLLAARALVQSSSKPSVLKDSLIVFFIMSLSVLQIITYEITQIMAFFSFFLFIYLLSFTGNSKSYFFTQHQSFVKVLKSKYVILYLVSSVIPFIIIRWHAFLICKNECYSTTDINPEYFRLENFNNGVMGAFPFYTIPISLQNVPNWYEFNSFRFILLFLTLFLFIYFSQFLFKFVKEPVQTNTIRVRLNVLPYFIAGCGFVLICVFSFANSLSQDSSVRMITLGQSNKMSLMYNFGISLIFLGILVLLINLIRSRFSKVNEKIVVSLIALPISIILSLNFVGNLLTTRASLSENNPYFLQTQFADAVAYPNLTMNGDSERCLQIKTKLRLYPSWYGADLYTIFGLNLTMQNRYNMPFCSIPDDVLFENYSGAR